MVLKDATSDFPWRHSQTPVHFLCAKFYCPLVNTIISVSEKLAISIAGLTFIMYYTAYKQHHTPTLFAAALLLTKVKKKTMY